MPSDESKNNKEAGQKQPGNVAFRDPRASTTEHHQKNGDRNTKPFAESAIMAHLQRVSIADSFGASPASSALDVSARRDPGGNSINLTRNRKVRIESDLATNYLGRAKQHLSGTKAWPVLRRPCVAGFKVTTEAVTSNPPKCGSADLRGYRNSGHCKRTGPSPPY